MRSSMAGIPWRHAPGAHASIFGPPPFRAPNDCGYSSKSWLFSLFFSMHAAYTLFFLFNSSARNMGMAWHERWRYTAKFLWVSPSAGMNAAGLHSIHWFRPQSRPQLSHQVNGEAHSKVPTTRVFFPAWEAHTDKPAVEQFFSTFFQQKLAANARDCRHTASNACVSQLAASYRGIGPYKDWKAYAKTPAAKPFFSAFFSRKGLQPLSRIRDTQQAKGVFLG